MGYKIYTEKYDQTVYAAEYLETRLSAPEIEEHTKSVDLYLSNQKAPDLSTSLTPAIDTRILVDLSGSMRGQKIFSTMTALLAIGDHLASEGRNFEILGYTTSAWKGGNSRKDWIDDVRTPNPGRLNDLLHIVFKDMTADWSAVRPTLYAVLLPGLLKENIDGEALQWARKRMVAEGDEAALIHIYDGAPIDDSTLSANPADYLRDHLTEVTASLQADGVIYGRLLLDDEYKSSLRSKKADEELHRISEPTAQSIVEAFSRLASDINATLQNRLSMTI